jgi:alpha-methylacyl-CoA racemase
MVAPALLPRGPLAGLRVVEFAGLGPAPFACMLLADMGADVVLVDRPLARPADPLQIVNRGRTVVHADLKSPADKERVLALLDAADVLVEGFRPGVMERLGLGPDVAMARNPRLVYGRMTGWGQEGPLAKTAGHDINYIALTGALAAIGPKDRPTPPLNLVGDYAGGSLYLALGVMAAVHEARNSGRGQIVDAAITDGVIQLMTHFIAQQQRGRFTEQRESNMLDGGAPWYGVYPTSDGQHVGVGAIEPQFFALLIDRLGLDERWKAAQHDEALWTGLRAAIASALASRTRADWDAVFADTDACVSPVLTLGEAMVHPHNLARGNFVEIEGVVHPAPAPRFSRTPTSAVAAPSGGPSTFDAAVLRWKDPRPNHREQGQR